jgi:gag-polyprotein putative aspartyl protease
VKFLSAVVVLLMFSFFGELLAHELYRWMDDRGIVHFADSLYSIPEKYRSEAEKRFFAPSSEMSTPIPQGDLKPANEPALRQPGVPFVQQGNKLRVEGFINQRGPVSFVVDTTAKVSSIPISVASRLGVNLGSALPFRMDGIGALPFRMDAIGITGRVLVRLVAIDSLRLGDLEVTNLEIEINPQESSGVGLLGMDFLGQFRVLVDHESQQMVLVREEGPYGGHRPECGGRRNFASIGN